MEAIVNKAEGKPGAEGNIFKILAGKSGLANFVLMLPYILGFGIFIAAPVVLAIALSFTNFNAVSFPDFKGLNNYVSLFTEDSVFMQYVIPNTITFSVIAGPAGYILSFFLAWLLVQIPKKPRTVLALCIYSPSMVTGVAMTVVWQTIFSGDSLGYLNALLTNWGVIAEPVQWLQDSRYLLWIMIGITIWGSMGVGFLAMIAGLLNVDPQLYEAAYMDGVKNRFQEIIYITIPCIKPQMLFGAVMAIVSTFSAGAIGTQLSGTNPTPRYAGQLILNHIDDYGIIRYEMGFASAISVVLMLVIFFTSKLVRKLLTEKD